MTQGKTRVRADIFQRGVRDSFAAMRGFQQWQEMMAASAMTMGLRLVDIQQKIHRNEPQDLAEWTRMFSEKNAAWWQAGVAVGRWQQALLKLWWQSPATSFTVFINLTGPQVMALSGRWTSITLRGTAEVMKPYHSRSTANAKRLSRRSN